MGKQSHTDSSVCPEHSGEGEVTNLITVNYKKERVLRITTFSSRTLLIKLEKRKHGILKEVIHFPWDIVGVSEIRRRSEELETESFVLP